MKVNIEITGLLKLNLEPIHTRERPIFNKKYGLSIGVFSEKHIII